MGLDVTAYAKVVRLDDHENCDDEHEAGHVAAYHLAGMEQSFRGLDQAWYDTSASEEFRFRAGSYSGYSAFRDRLSKIVLDADAHTVYTEQAEYRDRPFFELIAFADNEGTIGPEAAADLAVDFDDWAERVLPDLDEWDRQRYMDWRKAFHLAADHGLVEFH